MYLCKKLYGFATSEVGNTHIWTLQFVNPIVKALIEYSPNSRSTQ